MTPIPTPGEIDEQMPPPADNAFATLATKADRLATQLVDERARHAKTRQDTCHGIHILSAALRARDDELAFMLEVLTAARNELSPLAWAMLPADTRMAWEQRIAVGRALQVQSGKRHSDADYRIGG